MVAAVLTPSSPSLRNRPTDSPNTIKAANSPKFTSGKPEDEKLVAAVDMVLIQAFAAERRMNEALEDEKLPGVIGQEAGQKVVRMRRKSKELEKEFDNLMGSELESVFHRFDTDKSGSLDASELKTAFEAAGRPVDDETIRISMEALDTNNDGVVSLEEFKAIAWKCAMG